MISKEASLAECERVLPTDCPFPDSAQTIVDWVIHERKNTPPRRLRGPGPSPAQLEALMRAAAAAPDHGRLVPWRFITIPVGERRHLAVAFQNALLERDRSATPEQLQAAADKAERSPTLLLAVADLSSSHPEIVGSERLVSLGCAIQNMLLLSRAMGFGSGLSSGLSLQSTSLRNAFELRPDEIAVCFVSFGAIAVDRPHRIRPPIRDFFSVYGGNL